MSELRPNISFIAINIHGLNSSIKKIFSLAYVVKFICYICILVNISVRDEQRYTGKMGAIRRDLMILISDKKNSSPNKKS